MKNHDYIIIMKDNYVELRYKGTSLKMHMKTLENLYIFIGKQQQEPCDQIPATKYYRTQ
jgi:hypothetical protein